MGPLTIGLVGALVLGLAAFILIPQPTAFAPTPLVVSLPNFTNFQGELENPALPLVQISGDPSGATNSIDLHFRGRLGDAPVMYVRTGAPPYWRRLGFSTPPARPTTDLTPTPPPLPHPLPPPDC